MERWKYIVWCLALLFMHAGVFSQSPAGFIESNRKKLNINLDWKFSKMSDSEKPVKTTYNDDTWELVCLPHNPDPVSLMLDSTTEHWSQPSFLRDQSWYRKYLDIELTENEKVFLEFEGVHNATELWVNEKFVGRFEVNGYVPHHFDISNYIKSGEKNLIAILADNRFDPTIAPDPHETDYVKWGGIYRDVYLVKTNKVYVTFNWEDTDAGVHITTPTVNKTNGTVSIKTNLRNDYSSKVEATIETMIVDGQGYVLKKLQNKTEIEPKGTKTIRQTTDISDNYHLWSPDLPYLYRVISVIYMDGKAVDRVENKFGFRSIELVDGQGFLLNGEPFFMIGLNRHQNYPHIGDAVPNSMHYEAVMAYKKAGINTIRLSHYPQDNSFIEACDELGILLYEEPSTWIKWKEGEWMDKLEQSLRIMVRNHRNHPSIVIWGAGINHRGPVPQLNSAAKEEDPFRFTASASSPWNGIKNAGVTDIYATMDYRKTDFPEGSFSMVMEHGFSETSLGHQHHISRYKKRKNNIGTILWVGADYNHLRQTEKERDMITEYGLQTIYRVPRPPYYWYVSETIEGPFVHIADESVYKNEKVHIYSNAQKVALYADGELIAIQTPDTDPLRINNDHPSFTFHYNWTKEKLIAKAMIGTKEVATHSRTKQMEPYALKLMVDNQEMLLEAGGSDLKMVRAYVVDKNGELVTSADVKVHFTAKGAGSILYADKAYVDSMQTYHGVATVYLRGNEQAGEVTIQASANKLKSDNLSIKTKPFISDEWVKNSEPIYDYPNYKIDLQQEGQLEEFGWIIKNGGADNFTFKMDVCTFTLSADAGLKWRSGTYAVLGDLSFVACDGAYTASGKLKLTLSQLPKGKYKIKTYHHSFEKRDKLFPYNLEVERTDSNGTFKFISDDEAVGIFDAKDNGERKPVSVTTYIESDGINPVQLTFRTDKEGAHTWLNGLEFRQIK